MTARVVFPPCMPMLLSTYIQQQQGESQSFYGYRTEQAPELKSVFTWEYPPVHHHSMG